MLNVEGGQINGQLASAALTSEHQALSSLGPFALLAKGDSGNMLPKVFLSSKSTFFSQVSNWPMNIWTISQQMKRPRGPDQTS